MTRARNDITAFTQTLPIRGIDAIGDLLYFPTWQDRVLRQPAPAGFFSPGRIAPSGGNPARPETRV
ncbi:MAG: hypothetical protein HOW97_16645 [Catenulispora sp.]|nr:hypothetical protein [Catenulispora sp.]